MGSGAIAYVVFMGKKQSKIWPLNPVNVLSFSSEVYKTKIKETWENGLFWFSSVELRLLFVGLRQKLFLFREEIAILKMTEGGGLITQ